MLFQFVRKNSSNWQSIRAFIEGSMDQAKDLKVFIRV